MTLSQIASFICTKLNQNENNDLAACKSFLKRRFEMIWADQLWKDSLFEFTQTLNSTGYAVTNTWLPTKQVLLLPDNITHVVAVRSDTNKFNVESSERFYRMDYDQFATTGKARDYRLLSPVVWEFDVTESLYVNRAAGADSDLLVNLDLLNSDNRSVARHAIRLSQHSSLVGTSGRVDSFSKPQTNGAVTLSVQASGDLLAEGTEYSQPSGGIYYYTVTGFVVGQEYELTLGNAQSLSAGFTEFHTESGTFTATTDTYTINGPLYPGSLPAPPIVITSTIAAKGQNIVTLDTTDTNAPRLQRIQLFGTVADGTVLRVLGKIKAPTFEDDNDEPALTGVENTLIAFGEADMYQRERQLGKMREKAQEGGMLLEQLKKVQTTQQTHHKRLIPEDGYNWDYESRGISPLTF